MKQAPYRRTTEHTGPPCTFIPHKLNDVHFQIHDRSSELRLNISIGSTVASRTNLARGVLIDTRIITPICSVDETYLVLTYAVRSLRPSRAWVLFASTCYHLHPLYRELITRVWQVVSVPRYHSLVVELALCSPPIADISLRSGTPSSLVRSNEYPTTRTSRSAPPPGAGWEACLSATSYSHHSSRHPRP